MLDMTYTEVFSPDGSESKKCPAHEIPEGWLRSPPDPAEVETVQPGDGPASEPLTEAEEKELEALKKELSEVENEDSKPDPEPDTEQADQDATTEPNLVGDTPAE